MRFVELVATALQLVNAVAWPLFNHPWWTCLPWLLAAVLVQRFLVTD